MAFTPSKRDAWPQPKAWRHVWVRLNRHAATPAPAPGLVLLWEKHGSQWRAWTVWVDRSGPTERVRQEWLPADLIRPARSDINVWNDGPWR